MWPCGDLDPPRGIRGNVFALRCPMSLRAWYAAALLVAAGMLPASLASQLDSAATIRGTASPPFNGHPLAGVMVSGPRVHRFAVFGFDGSFELGGLPPSPHRVVVH